MLIKFNTISPKEILEERKGGKKGERTIDTCNNMDEFQNNYVEWKKPEPTKKYIPYDSSYVKLKKNTD